MKELNIIKNVCQNSFWRRTWSYKGEVKKSYNKLNNPIAIFISLFYK